MAKIQPRSVGWVTQPDNRVSRGCIRITAGKCETVYMVTPLEADFGRGFTLAKTVRDLHEANRMINRIDEARTEKLLSAQTT